MFGALDAVFAVGARAHRVRVSRDSLMPELPEVQAHAERLTEQFAGRVLAKFVPFNFTALKTAVPAPDEAYGSRCSTSAGAASTSCSHFEPVTFVVHLMQGGRLLVDDKQSAKPRDGQARFVFAERRATGAAAHRGGQGTARRGVVRATGDEALDVAAARPARTRGAPSSAPSSWLALFAAKHMRLHGFLRDQHIDRRARPDAGQRGLPPGQALAVRDRPRKLGDDGAHAGRRTRSASASTKASPTSAHGPT